MNAVIIGAPLEEQTVVGPFSNFDEADAWCCDHLKQEQYTWVITLYSPDAYEG